MSTNKTLKRIALVAVASLGFGLVSVAPSNAGERFVTSAIALTASTSPTVGAAVSITAVASTPALSANTDVVTLKAAMVSKPATAAGALYTDQTADTATCDYGADIASANAAGVVAMTVTYVNAATCAAASTTFGTFKFDPTVAGTYTIRVWNDQAGAGIVDLGEESADITITVAAANTTPSATYSTIEAWSVTTPTASKAAGTALAGADEEVTVTVKNSADAALNAQTIRAVVKGPGFVSLGGDAAGRDVSKTLAANANTVVVKLTADGSAGSQTVDIYAGTTLLGTTKAVVWYGTLAKLVVTQKKSVVGKNAAATTAVTISGVDADGVAVPLADNTVVGTSSDTTVLTDKVDADDSVTSGVITLQVKGANDVTTTSGRSATMTYKYLISGTTYATADPLTFTIGGAVATVAITLDKAAYAPGEKVTATVSAKDSLGNAAADSEIFAAAATGTLTSSMAAQGITTAAISTVGGTATTTFFAPASSGSFTISGSTTIAGTATTITSSSATVVNAAETAAVDAAAAAADAAAEAIDAANAATDAANLAAEAADAATVAAEEARDAADAATAAVEELATQVATLMAALKAQITTLANTVAKIAKKVKA